MDKIPDDRILEFPSDTLEAVRKELNLQEPGAIEEIINNFQEWINKQNHFIKKDFSRRFLENVLISAKGSLERAKKDLDKMCTAKTLRRDLTENIDANQFPNITIFTIPAVLPKMTQQYHRVYLVRVVSADFDSNILYYYYKFIMLMVEYLKYHDYSMGFHAIFDFRNVNVLKVMMKVDLLESKSLINLATTGGYALRLKGVHLMSESAAIDDVIGYAKLLLSPKLRERVHVHRNLESVHELIPKDILPQEYGGKEKPLEALHSDWKAVLGSEDIVELLKESTKPATDESLRPAASYNEDVLGMPGSFRNMRVD